MEAGVIFKHRINYKQRYKSRVKKSTGLYYVEPQSTPKDTILSTREIIKIYVRNLHYVYSSYSLSGGLCAPWNTRACLVYTENLCLRWVYVCTCVSKKQRNNRQEGGDKRARTLAIN